MKLRPWLEGAGLALLYLLSPLLILLDPAHHSFYHELLPVTTMVRGLGLDLLFLSIASGAYMLLINHCSGGTRRLLELMLFLFAGWSAARDGIVWINDAGLRDHMLERVRYLPILILLAVLILWRMAPDNYSRASSALRALLAAGGVSLLLLVGPLVAYSAFRKSPLESASFNKPLTQSRVGDRRIVWLLFDELSYNQVFDHRAPNLQLPAFDTLARESTLFTDLRPVGYHTDSVIPSLFLGQPIREIQSDAWGDLEWRAESHGPWNMFDPQQSVFAKAQQLGWPSGVVGWYNPYCRILAPVLQRCYWIYSDPVAGELFSDLSSRRTTLANAFYALPLAARLKQSVDKATSAPPPREDYATLLAQGKALIADPGIRFAFVHMPAPHPPTNYQRPGSGPHKASYLDNLVRADQALAQLESAIAATADTSNTVLLVSSDHSWRTEMWRGSEYWSPEDEKASHGGVFDDRPVLLVHFPKQTSAHRVDRPTSAMTVHALILNLLAGNLDPDQLLQPN